MIQSLMKKKIALLLVLSLTITMMIACGNTSTNNAESGGSDTQENETDGEEQTTDYETLNVGILVSTVGVPALYAEEQGYFEDAGLDVNMIIFPTGAPLNESIAASELDIACSGFASVYSLATGTCQWLMDINTTGGMGIYARADSDIAQTSGQIADYPSILGSADTIKGTKILGPLGTAAQFNVIGYIEKFGLNDTDVEQVHMEYAAGYQSFIAGEGDLFSVSPPWSYDLEDDDVYVKVSSFEDATGVNLVDGCFARTEIVEGREEEVQLFIDCIMKAMDELQDEEVRFDFTWKKFNENASATTEEALEREMKDRIYCGTDFVTADEYVFGECWAPISEFLATQEKITKDQIPGVEASLNSSFLSQTIGKDIN